MDLRIDVFHHFDGGNGSAAEILSLLRAIKAQGETIVANTQQALDAIKQIDVASTKQGETLQALADNEQKVSDNLDALIAKIGNSVPDDVIAGLKAAADHAQTVSDHLSAQADFSKALASKGADTPVPVPVPVAPPA